MNLESGLMMKNDNGNTQRTTVQGNVPVPQQKSYEENESRNQEKCKQSKPASCKGRRFNKESESENHRMEELLLSKTNEKWMQALDWYIICTFTRWYNKKHQSRNHMSKVGFVRNSIYKKGLKKMARA